MKVKRRNKTASSQVEQQLAAAIKRGVCNEHFAVTQDSKLLQRG